MASSAAENRKKIEEALRRGAYNTVALPDANKSLPSRPINSEAIGKIARARQQAGMQPTFVPGNVTQPVPPPTYKPSPGLFGAKTEKIPTPKGIPDLPTSHLPVEDPQDVLAPPPPGIKGERDQERKLADRYKNFQRLRDAQRKQQIRNLTNIQRLGYNAANIVKKATGPATDRIASLPAPGGVALPLLILLVLVMLLIPVNGETRIMWLWKTITGTASINPYAKPPETQFSVRTSNQGQQGGGPPEQQPTAYDEGLSDNPMPWYTTYIPSTSTYDEW